MLILYWPLPKSSFSIFLHSSSADWENQMGISRLSILLPLCTDEWVASLYFNDMGFLSGGGTGGGCWALWVT